MSRETGNKKYRRGTTYSVSFPTLPTLRLTPRRIEIHQKQYHHDLLVMEFSNTSPKWFELMRTGVPFEFNWSQAGLSNSFVGYVSYVSKNVAGQIEDVMEVHCVGSTFPLKERSNRVFSDVSIPKAVKTIVQEFGFNFIGEDNGVVFEQLTMAGHSYWEWIQEQAKRIGYGVAVHNMNFFFRPLDKLIDQSVTNAPVLEIDGTEFGINNELFDRTLDWFKVLNGEYIEDSDALRATKTVGGVSPLTGRMVSSTKSPSKVGENVRSNVSDVLFSEFRCDKVANSKVMADAMAEGSAQRARFNMPAMVKCQGDPRIRPFAPVVIQGTGPITDGYWIAKEVRHMFARIGDYQIEMKVTADGTGLERVTSIRQGTKNAVGVVNLEEAMRGDSPIVSALKQSKAVLTSKTGVSKESGQGFRRTPAVWRHQSFGGK